MITDISQLDLTRQYTFADYLTWQFTERVELVRGWIMRMAAPAPLHQRIATNLTRSLANHFWQSPCEVYPAPLDVRLPLPKSERKANTDESVLTVVQPHLCVICDTDKIDAKGCLGAPDLVVEILSPGNTKKEMQRKKELYEESGVREYWVIDPLYKGIQVFVLNESFAKYDLVHDVEEGDDLTSVIFPTFTVAVSDVFYRYSK